MKINKFRIYIGFLLGCPSGMSQRSADNGAVFSEHYANRMAAGGYKGLRFGRASIYGY